MKSLVLLPAQLADDAATVPLGGPPNLALAFLPAGAALDDCLATMTTRWPAALVLGCEASSQFADGQLESGGCVQLLRFESPRSKVWVEVLEAVGEGGLPPPDRLDRAARHLAEAEASFLLADGLRFPTMDLLSALRQRLPQPPRALAGGLASQELPLAGVGARVFVGRQVYPAGCLLIGFAGIRMDVEIVRGWDPASPVYTVTRAAGQTIHEIDGEPVTDWYRRFFTLDHGPVGEGSGPQLAPMPDSAYNFPLILEGPDPARHGLYRSMQRFDEEAKSVTYWGDVQTGDRVRLGIGNGASLERAAAALGRSSGAESAVLYSCVGREAVLDKEAHREAAAIHRALGGIALAGFFTFGEIGPTPLGGLAFYNQTAVLALLREQVRPARPDA